MNKQCIPVVWGLDEKYLLPAFVVMHSILKNSNRQYQFYIITADDIMKQVKEYVALLKKEYNNFNVDVKLINGELFKDIKIYNKYLSISTYFRLLISNLITEYEKCIYLDCDVLINGDLAEFFDFDLEDDYIAGVKDCHIIQDTPREREHEKVLGIPSRDKYINAGVLLLNLKKVRKDNLVHKFFAQMSKENWYEDQDVLNICCYPYIKTLPLKYNLFHFYCGNNIKLLYNLDYKKQDFDFKEPLVIHMGGIWKPWAFRKVKGADQWWNLASIFKNTKYYKEHYENIYFEDEKVFKLVEENENKKFIICGYSKNGKNLCDIILQKRYSVVAFFDNDRKKWGQTYKNIPVMGIEQIVENYNDIFWIISNQIAFKEIQNQILSYGFEKKNVVRYINYYDNKYYLLSLDSKYYDLEIDKIAMFEYTEKYKEYDKRKEYILKILSKPVVFKEEYNYLNNKYHFNYWYHI